MNLTASVNADAVEVTKVHSFRHFFSLLYRLKKCLLRGVPPKRYVPAGYRTQYLLLTRQMLYHLSYRDKIWPCGDSNSGYGIQSPGS